MTASSLQFVVMAAGQGKRMHSAVPKVLHPLAGRPLVAHVLATARTLDPRKICVVVGHGGEAVAAALAAPDLAFVTQDPPRGTGDAVRAALGALAEDGITVVMNGDCPLVPAAALRAVADLAKAGGLALLTARIADPSGLGRIVRDANGAVTGIVEDKDATRAQRAIDEIYSGVLAAPTALLRKWVAAIRNDNAQGEYYLTDVLAMAVAERKPVTAHLAAREEDVLGVNDRAQLASIERILQRQQAHALLTAGAWIADPERFDLRGTLVCGRDVRIDIGSVFEGDVRLGDNVSIRPHCVLRNVTIGAGTTIEAFTHIESSTVGANCRIGPYARIRPDSALSDDVHIGNFVEVKASTLGRGAKANHLAYLGDTTVGHAVNYGAGAITANYDGANKHRTVIGDNAHIGSNCVLVAPVAIGEGATIGAGSVIAADAPPGGLTLARSRQVSIAGWKRPVKKRPVRG